MENHILDAWVENRSLDPVAAEVLVVVAPQQVTPATELRGRLMGPSCPYASTVEIAYPLVPLRRSETVATGPLGARVAIPEASLWHPQTPFLYRGSVELWQDGKVCDRVVICHGLRQMALSQRGLKVNGAAFAIRALELESTRRDIAELREQGFNCLVIPVSADDPSPWDEADRLGMFLIGRVSPDQASLERVIQFSRRPSCLGWLTGETQNWPPNTGLVGTDITKAASDSIPANVHFLVGTPQQIPALECSGIPFLLAESSPAGTVLRGFQSKM